MSPALLQATGDLEESNPEVTAAALFERACGLATGVFTMKTLADERGSIFIFRHAQSAANAGRPTSDPASIPITQTGVGQAQVVAGVIAARPGLIVVSRYLRTIQTAEPLLLRYPGTPVDEWPIEEFTYLDPIACTGTTYAERKTARDNYWHRCDPLYIDSQRCESFSDFVMRVRRLETALVARPAHETVVVFTHGFVMLMLLWLQGQVATHIRQEEMTAFDIFRRRVSAPNCALLRAEAGGQGRLRISSPPSVSHLPVGDSEASNYVGGRCSVSRRSPRANRLTI